MQSTERQKFEEDWKSAFDGAEMTPSESVWNSIELDLAGQESAAMKKRVVFYQRLAAATVLFALLTGTYAFYTNFKSGPDKLAVVDNKVSNENKVANDQSTPEATTSETTKSETETTSQDVNTAGKITTSKNGNNNTTQQSTIAKAETPVLIAKEETVTKEQITTETVAANESLVPVETVASNDPLEKPADDKQGATKEVLNEEPKKEVTSPILQNTTTLASLEPQDEPEKTRARKNSGGDTWLAVGGGAGNYSPNSGSSASAMADKQASFGPANSSLQAAADANANNKTKVGTAYSFGMAVGKKFGRFVVQTGVNLNKQQVDYTSSYDSRSQSANTAKASMADYSMAESADLSPTNAYTVNSSMEIVSIPVQAGYMIIDRKLGWQFNAGFSPDFFLKNTLVDKSGQRERFTQGAGDASPYRSVNWSGLFNTELSYKIGQHYRISLVPGVRYSFNSLLKEPGDSGKPLILDVGFRFKYLFD